MTAVDTVLFVDRHDSDRAQFDEATHTWTVGGRCSRVIIASDGALPTHLSPADNLDPYLGVAVHGVPNYFLVTGPDAAAQKGFIARCLDYMDHTDSTRIEVRSSTQRYFNDHARKAICVPMPPTPITSAFFPISSIPSNGCPRGLYSCFLFSQ